MIPDFLIKKLSEQYGMDSTNKIIEGFKSSRSTTIRVNTLKTTKEIIKKTLNENNIICKDVPWYDDALVIEDGHNKLTSLSIYENGEIYLQSLSSMIPPLVIDPNPGETILDMAAAPGSKTTQMSNLSYGNALITACEKNRIRCERLKYNINKQGSKKISVINSDALELDDFFSFDKILLDAPCSGSGTIIQGKTCINEKLIKNCTSLQEKLILKALKLLKKDGILVYSTCSILKEENEYIIKKLIDKNLVELIPLESNMFNCIPLLPTCINGTYCIKPNSLYEGFFISKLRKK